MVRGYFVAFDRCSLGITFNNDNMKVMVACEESQVVCKAFRERGHEAYSCDILPCSGGHPEWHIQTDITEVITNLEWSDLLASVNEKERGHKWDMMIAFPPCTHLAVSGARWFPEKQKDGRQQDAINFFMMLVNAPIDKIAIENPIGIMSTKHRKPDQIIQPYQFGHTTSKATCLWLYGLPKLVPTNIIAKEQRTQDIWRMAPGPDRQRLRSRTFEGIAQAMADQWG